MGRVRRGGKRSAAAKAKARAAAGSVGRGEKNETASALGERGGNQTQLPSACTEFVRPLPACAAKTFHTIRNGPAGLPPAEVIQPVKELVSVGKSALNLCLFSAAFNVLQQDAERKAFARGNLIEPPKAFFDFMRETSTAAQAKWTALHGYTILDICLHMVPTWGVHISAHDYPKIMINSLKIENYD